MGVGRRRVGGTVLVSGGRETQDTPALRAIANGRRLVPGDQSGACPAVWSSRTYRSLSLPLPTLWPWWRTPLPPPQRFTFPGGAIDGAFASTTFPLLCGDDGCRRGDDGSRRRLVVSATDGQAAAHGNRGGRGGEQGRRAWCDYGEGKGSTPATSTAGARSPPHRYSAVRAATTAVVSASPPILAAICTITRNPAVPVVAWRDEPGGDGGRFVLRGGLRGEGWWYEYRTMPATADGERPAAGAWLRGLYWPRVPSCMSDAGRGLPTQPPPASLPQSGLDVAAAARDTRPARLW